MMQRMSIQIILLMAFSTLAVGVLAAVNGDPPERTKAMVDTAPLQTPVEFFPILPWDPLHGWDGKVDPKQGIESIAACNFT
ncbi:MAG: hypothetical protein U9Q79_09885, partial [Candidatus Hydrogenedentes bacterium]|nr:hypothetical protein [Candidatus Hydrogenedentota bacterium]